MDSTKLEALAIGNIILAVPVGMATMSGGAASNCVRAFGGAPLVGDRLVRVIYVDETGHSFKEPVAAVGGVLLDPDRQWLDLSNAIAALKTEVPEKFRPDFVFHAAKLFNKSQWGDDWGDEDRWALLERLLALPRQLEIPLVLGFSIKPEERGKPDTESKVVHAMAYLLCLKAADFLMKSKAPANEVAMIVAEDRKEARAAIRAAHNLAVSEKLINQWLPPVFHEGLPITRIKAPVAFASKDEEPLLQIADACSWAFQRHLRSGWMCERFITAMFGNFMQPAVLGQMRSMAGNYLSFWWQKDEQFS
jgi:hypothetical protein